MKMSVIKLFFLCCIACIVFIFALGILNQNYKIFSNQHYLMMITDNYNRLHSLMPIIALVAIANYRWSYAERIKLLSVNVFFVMLPYIFLLILSVEILIRMYNGEAQFDHKIFSYLYFGYFVFYYSLLIIITAYISRISMIHQLEVDSIESF